MFSRGVPLRLIFLLFYALVTAIVFSASFSRSLRAMLLSTNTLQTCSKDYRPQRLSFIKVSHYTFSTIYCLCAWSYGTLVSLCIFAAHVMRYSLLQFRCDDLLALQGAMKFARNFDCIHSIATQRRSFPLNKCTQSTKHENASLWFCHCLGCSSTWLHREINHESAYRAFCATWLLVK